MRVTQQMMVAQSTANLSTAIDRLMRLQGQMSSGRRIGRPSDDAPGVTRALSLRTTLANLEQYRSNVSWGGTQLAAVEESLGGANTLMVRARELAVSLANDNYDATARHAAAAEAKSILEQLLKLGNTQDAGRYLFSGFRTRAQTFLASTNGVVYQGDYGVINAQVEAGSQMAINLIGADVFLSPLQILGGDFDLDRGVVASVPLADLRMGSGIDQTPGTVLFTDENSGLTIAVDLSAATTVGDMIAAINAQLTAGGMTGVTASLGPTGNALRLTAVDNGLISAATPLANLQGGSGVDLVPGTFRVMTDDGAINVSIDLTGASTVGDLITAFNTQLAAAGVNNVTMSVNPAQDGLRITDANATPLGLHIVDLPEEQTAFGLGILGYVNSDMIGAALNPIRSITVAESGAGETTAADLGLAGTFRRTKDGADLDPILTLATSVNELDKARGLTLGRLRIQQGSDVVDVNLVGAATVGDVINRINASGLSVNASLNASGRGIQIVTTANDRSLIVGDADGIGSARSLGIAGSPDLFGGMMLLVSALDNDNRAGVGALIGLLESASDHLLDERASVGAKIRRLNATTDRLEDLSLLMTGLLSDIEDADIVKVTTQLATQQNVYQSALNAVSRVLTPSLVDFIR